MENQCHSCRQPLPEGAKVCTACGSPQTLAGRAAAALKWIGGIATVISLMLGVNSLVGLYQGQLERREAVEEVAAAADQLRDDGDYARAWKLYAEAEAMDPGSRTVRRGQELLARAWLPNVHISGDETFTDIVDLTLPVLMRALVRAEGTEAADIQALVGWAHYLEQRERPIQDADVPGLYRRALELEPDNAFANAFLGHWHMSQERNLEEGMRHFTIALDSGKQRRFVRGYQWTALSNLKRKTTTGEPEHIAVRKEQLIMMSQMLNNGEPWVTRISDTMPREAIEAYGRPDRQSDDWFDQVWPVLSAQQHIALISRMSEEVRKWDFLHQSSLYLLARIYEKSGDREQALVFYRRVDAAISATHKLRAPLENALQRLTGEPGRYALLRDDPFKFHGNALLTGTVGGPDFKRAVRYFEGLVSDVHYQRELDKVEPAIKVLTRVGRRITERLEQSGDSEVQGDLLDHYWRINSALGELLLYNRSLDKSTSHYRNIIDSGRLRIWMKQRAFYNLACSLSLRSQAVEDKRQQQTDREQAVGSLLESIKLGYNQWEHIKRDADLDAIRNHPEYIRVMTGR